MEEFVAVLVSGIGLGAIYGLVALGFALVLKGTGMLNFAHGAFMVLGAYIAFSVGSRAGFWAGFVAAVLALAGIGVLLYFLVLRRLVGRGAFAGLMVTIGLYEIILAVTALIYGHSARNLPDPTHQPRIEFTNGVSVATPLAIAAIVLVAAAGGLGLFLMKTRVGLQIRALGQSSSVTLMLGASPAILFALTWGISAGLGAGAGTLLASLTVADLELASFMLRALSGLVVGGADSLAGAMVGGVLVGAIELLAGNYLGSEYRLVTTMTILLAFMLLRPQGLFGSERLQRA